PSALPLSQYYLIFAPFRRDPSAIPRLLRRDPVANPRRYGRLFRRRSASSGAPERRALQRARQRSGSSRNKREPRIAADAGPPGIARPSAARQLDHLFA